MAVRSPSRLGCGCVSVGRLCRFCQCRTVLFGVVRCCCVVRGFISIWKRNQILRVIENRLNIFANENNINFILNEIQIDLGYFDFDTRVKCDS